MHIGRRSRRSIGENDINSKEKSSDELIDKRLKRDLSAIYDPDDLDEVFKQTLNQQHQHREKRSRDHQEAPIRNRVTETSKRMLFSKPFWDVRPDRRRLPPETVHGNSLHNGGLRRLNMAGDLTKGDGGAASRDSRSNMMSGMLKKRWKIPGKSFFQVISI